MSESQINVEQKLAEAVRLIKGASRQFEKVGLELDFTITIKAQPPAVTLSLINDPGENTPPSKYYLEVFLNSDAYMVVNV